MDESQAEQPSYAVAMTNRGLLSVLALGGIVGLFVWGAGLVLNRYLFDVVFCQNGIGNQCAYATSYAEGAAIVIGSILALFGLIRLNVYRPLLVVLASAISLWGIAVMAWGMAWYWGALIAAVMYLLAYGLFAWVARIRMFLIALVATVVLVAAVRLALML
jgi:hypothetical protein